MAATIEADPTVPAIRLTRDGEEYAFRGCFHTVREDPLVQTFTFQGWPDGVAPETLTFEHLGNGYSRLHATSLAGHTRSDQPLPRSPTSAKQRVTETAPSPCSSHTLRGSNVLRP